jgi:uncharacterized radical SAM superfamily Fe-S cluster-containing enzyme
MPKEVFGADYAFLPRSELLSFEEIERVARVFVGLGVEKLRLTGGEPLVRRDLPVLVAKLAELRRRDGGPLDLTLTTNGSALRALAGPLADAGLQGALGWYMVRSGLTARTSVSQYRLAAHLGLALANALFLHLFVCKGLRINV